MSIRISDDKLFFSNGSTIFTTSHLKIKILVQNQGGPEFQPAGILPYVEDLKEGANTEFGTKDYFEIACNPTLRRRVKRLGISAKE